MTSTGRRRLRRLAERFSAASDARPEPGRPPLPAEPLLSVVVPVYAVERYLPACLDSVLDQSWTALEVVVVDDGSPDGSAAIAQEYADRDPRVRIVRQANAGLGAARNRGIAEATGDLVTFLDSDDLVPPYAYRTMVTCLLESGSDFVVGALQRLEGDELVERTWMRTLHAERRTAITIDDLPDALTNVFACTKVFRRDFLTDHDFAFPVGVRYEDQHPITRAFLLAQRFDLVPDPVYTWRIREDGSSITQQKGSSADLHDRVLAIRQVLAAMHDLASPAVREGWLTKVFRHDLMAYFRAAVEAEAETRSDYFAELSSVTADLVAEAPEGWWEPVELRHRVAIHLAVAGDLDGLEELLAREDLRSSDFPVSSDDGALVADLGDLDVPPELLRLRPVDFPPRTFLSAAQLDGQVLALSGIAFLRHLDAERADVGVALVLQEQGGSGEMRTPGTRTHDDRGDLVARRSHEDHTDSGFAADLDLAALVAATPDRPSTTTWTCAVALQWRDVEAVEGLRERPESGSTHAERAVVVDGALVTTAWSERDGFLVRVQRRFAAATAVRWDGTDALVDLATPGVEPIAVLLGGKPCGADLEPSGAPDHHQARIPVQDIADADRLGTRLGLDVGAKRPMPIITAWPLDIDVPEGEPGFGLGTTDMVLKVVRDRPQLVVEHVEIDGSVATVTGIASVPAAELRLNGPRGLLAPAPMVREGRRFTAEVPLATGEGTLPPATTYALTATHDDRRIRVVAARGLAGRAEVAASPDWLVEVDLEMLVTFQRRAAAEVGLTSRRHRQQVQPTYAAARERPRTGDVLLVPSLDEMLRLDLAAVADALRERGAEPVWAARAGDPAPDADLRTVVRGTEEWYVVLGGAAAVLAAGRLPGDAVRAEGQRWVGMLKRPDLVAGDDDEEPDEDDETELDWHVAPAGNEAAAAGEVRVLGAARTDRVLTEDRGSTRARVRAALGVPADALVVFHAPTRRWAGAAGDGDEGARVLLDVPVLLSGRADVVVWGRGRAADWPMLELAHPGRVRDTTWHPQPLELLAAADALVTDFSPLMVEACVLRVPVVRHLPDEAGAELEESVAPGVGPVAHDLAQVLAELGHDPAAFESGRAALIERLAPRDDGGAARRIADALLDPS